MLYYYILLIFKGTVKNMKNKKPKSTKAILLTLLRKKQSKGIMPYITTKSTSYKIFRWSFFALVLICTFINLLYIFGKSNELNANLANMGEVQLHQEPEIAHIKASINIMSYATIGLVLSEVFIWFKLPFLQLISCLASSLTIIFRMSSEIKDPTENVLARNHIIPLSALCFFCIVSASLYLHQLYKDKKGCNEISEIIYKKYGAIAKDISPDEWDTVLAEYDPHKSNSKKRSVKARLKKQNKKDIETNNKGTSEE